MVVKGDNGKSVNKEWEKQLVPEAGYEIFFGKTQRWRTNVFAKVKEICLSLEKIQKIIKKAT